MKTCYTTTTRLLLTALLCLGLLACGDADKQTLELKPVPFHSGDECHVCGMIITDFPGPKGEVVEKGSVKKFCSVAEMIGWHLQPENQHLTARLYVHDMGRSEWDKPDDAQLIDATQAYYVVGTQLKGAMGLVLASFADQQAAQQLAERDGGKVLRFPDIDQKVLQMDPAMCVTGDHEAADHQHSGH
ncbi:copper chaperone NosL [Pseudomonas pohangensis]|uniref:Copper chaperone NosL n=1 Tax=Pseudomonas pohangensis TaxID=364197 RepID=A0A1H2FFR1_9PSED|nr:nitrous oxide reductase accessory protein NosL [Pseudomonas pohangensis]SDU06204.1 copper chaperone NosL [Pseudomonas pohangensis]